MYYSIYATIYTIKEKEKRRVKSTEPSQTTTPMTIYPQNYKNNDNVP